MEIMRIYELIVVVKTSLSQTQRKNFVETIKSWLKGVTVNKENDWGQKVLSYPIQREQAGVYYQFSLESDNSVPLDVEKKLTANENVLRHLLIRTK